MTGLRENRQVNRHHRKRRTLDATTLFVAITFVKLKPPKLGQFERKRARESAVSLCMVAMDFYQGVACTCTSTANEWRQNPVATSPRHSLSRNTLAAAGLTFGGDSPVKEKSVEWGTLKGVSDGRAGATSTAEATPLQEAKGAVSHIC